METQNEQNLNVQKQETETEPKPVTREPNPTTQVLIEFKQWKKTLINMIRTKASLQFYDETNYKFILPPGLVRLVWDVTINERIAAQDQALPPQEKVKKAYESLQKDLNSASRERLLIENAKMSKAQMLAEAPKKPVQVELLTEEDKERLRQKLKQAPQETEPRESLLTDAEKESLREKFVTKTLTVDEVAQATETKVKPPEPEIPQDTPKL